MIDPELKEKPSTAILHYTAPPIVGGVEAVIQAHCQVFRDQGYPIAVVAGKGDPTALANGTEFFQIPELDTQLNEVLEISNALQAGKVPNTFESFTSRLYDLLEPIVVQYDNLLVHNIFTKHFNIPLTAALSRLIDDKRIKNCIAWCHDFTWTSPSSKDKVHHGYPWDLLREFNPKLTYVVVSEERKAVLARLLEKDEDSVRVIYNGVDPKILYGLSKEGERLVRELSLFKSDLIILMPIRVTKAKNIEFALDLLAVLKSQGVKPKLIVTGPPDPHSDTIMAYYRSLKRKRKYLGLINEMHFVYESGVDPDQPYEIDMDMVGELFRISDILLMPSHREGFGMPVLEAGMIGIPAICTSSVPAAVEIGGEDVTLFDANLAPESLGHQILNWMKSNPQHRFRQRVRMKFTWEAIFRQEIMPLLKGPH